MKNKLSEELGKRVHEARVNKKMSLQELADKLGYNSRTSVLRIERGEQDIPLFKIQELARILDVAPDYLMQWNTETGSSDVLVEHFAQLDNDDKALISNYVMYLLSNEKYKKLPPPKND